MTLVSRFDQQEQLEGPGLIPGNRLRIRDAEPHELNEAVDVLTAAAVRTPLGEWLTSDPQLRETYLRARFHAILNDATRRPQVRLAVVGGRITAAAVWTTCLSRRDHAAVRLQPRGDNPKPLEQRAWRLELALAIHHPTRPHQHLLSLGVRPDRQRHGIGSILLVDYQQAAEPAVLPRFLVATCPRSWAMLRRHGYTARGEPITVSAAAPRLWPLWAAPDG